MLIKLKSKSGPKGSYGSYHKLTRTKGVKVLKGSYKSVMDAINSYQMEEAMKERDLLLKVQHSGMTPKCYGVAIVEWGKKFRVGIVMEHLGETRLSDLGLDEDEESDIMAELEDKICNFGINHTDIHSYNVMFKNRKYYVIDFSPERIEEHDREEQDAA